MADIPEGIGTHTMRKTFGYWYYKQTKDIATLQTIHLIILIRKLRCATLESLMRKSKTVCNHSNFSRNSSGYQ